MSFQNPVLLLGLLALPAGAVLYWLRQRRPPADAVRFTGVATLLAALPQKGRWRRHIPAALLGLALAGLLVAVARPQRSVAVPLRSGSIMLVTDTSRSMLADDVEPSRLEAARTAAKRFLSRVPGNVKVGLIGFSGVANPVIAPTDDRDEIKSVIDTLRADGSTATGDALDTALTTLRPRGARDRRPAAIVLLSDGKRTSGSDPIEVARRARQLGVRVTTVALGNPGTALLVPGTNSVIPVPPDPETMRQIARNSGGRFFAVDDADQLNSVYENLGTRLSSRTEHREITAGFAGGAAILLLAAVAASVRRFGVLS
jgi:Ca-activated chloride channel family protein